MGDGKRKYFVCAKIKTVQKSEGLKQSVCAQVSGQEENRCVCMCVMIS